MRHPGGLGNHLDNDHIFANRGNPSFNVLIIQRPAGLGRRIQNLQSEVMSDMFARNSFGGVFDVTVWGEEQQDKIDKEGFIKLQDGHNPVNQMLQSARYDILIGGHGSALSFGTFMNKGFIVELLPQIHVALKSICEPGWNANKYSLFGEFAIQSGNQHYCLASSYTEDATEEGIAYWRHKDVIVPRNPFNHVLHDIWSQLMWDRHGVHVPGPQMSPLNYADDIPLFFMGEPNLISTDQVNTSAEESKAELIKMMSDKYFLKSNQC